MLVAPSCRSNQALVVACLFAFFMMLPCAAGADGNLHFNLGVRYPDHGANSDAGTHPEASVDAAFGRSTWPMWTQVGGSLGWGWGLIPR